MLKRNDGRDCAIDFGDIFDGLPSPHMVLDRNHCYVAVNKAYEKVVMRGRDELIGRNLFDLFPNDGESGQRLRDSFDRVIETGEADTLAYIPYDIPRPPEKGGGMEQRYWTAVHTPVSGKSGTDRYVMQNTVDVTDIVRLRQAASLPFRRAETQLLERAREAEEQHKALMSESAEFRRLFQLAPGFFAVLTGPDHVFTFANDAYMRLVGERQLIGKPVREAMPEVSEQGIMDLLDEVYRTGTQYQAESRRLMIRNTETNELQETFLDFSYDAIR
ncbi:MAG: PAS domain-containing protein, partial [Hoeflea sp.]